MVELENPFSWFTDDPWVLLITTIGLLVMTGLAMFEGIRLFREHHNRPRVQLKAVKEYENTKEGRKVTFWVYAHNIGRGILSQCKVRIRITNHAGSIDLIDKKGKKYQEEFIPFNWEVDENQFTNELDLYPAKTEYGKFKLPFIATIHEDDSGVGMQFTDPVEISFKKNPTGTLKGLGKLLTIYVVFSIFINSKELSFEKKFRIVIPLIDDQLKDKYVIFEEKKIWTLFSDNIYSFLTLFKKFDDEK